MTSEAQVILRSHQIRKSKKQKQAFAAYLKDVAQSHGYSLTEESGALGARNLIVGDPDRASVVYTAHYDTCARLPFPNFITPKNIFVYLLYQLLITALLFVPATLASVAVFGIGTLLSLNPDLTFFIAFWAWYLLLIAALVMIVAGPANKNTVNDNTSGVITLLEIMCALPEKQRDRVAFVFFDLEELGLFGSSGFHSRHKQAMKQKLLLNFDCVSDGEYMLLAVRKRAHRYLPALEQAFPTTDAVKVELCTRGVFYPSDQSSFPCGVGVAALKYSRLLRTLYMDRIHTARDTVCRQENIEYLTDCAIRLVDLV